MQDLRALGYGRDGRCGTPPVEPHEAVSPDLDRGLRSTTRAAGWTTFHRAAVALTQVRMRQLVRVCHRLRGSELDQTVHPAFIQARATKLLELQDRDLSRGGRPWPSC